MSITSRIGISVAIVCLALAVPGSAKAQIYGGYGYGPTYGYGTSYYGVRPGYGYGYGYNSGYSYAPQVYVPPQTYNNLNGIAGMFNQTVNRRPSYYGRPIRRRW